MTVERTSINNISTRIADMETEKRLVQEKIEKINESIRSTRRLLVKETNELRTLKNDVWNSKDQGVIDLTNQILALSIIEVNEKLDTKKCKIFMSFEVDGKKYEVPSSIEDDLNVFMKIFRTLEKNDSIRIYSTDWFLIRAQIDKLRKNKAKIKSNVWKSLNPDIIKLRELLLFTMKMSK